LVFQLRFKDIVSNHEHRQGKFSFNLTSSKEHPPEALTLHGACYVYYRRVSCLTQGKINFCEKFFRALPIDKAFQKELGRTCGMRWQAKRDTSLVFKWW
jgi:hypothetical protein